MKNKKTIGPLLHKVEPFFIADYFKSNKVSILYIGKDDREITNVKNKLKWLLPNIEILLFKAWDQIPYDKVSPSKEIQIERLKTLNALLINKTKKIVLATVNSIIQKILPKDIINKNFLNLSVGKKINFDYFINKILILGFQRSSLVRDKSEFSIRGSIFDIFPSDYEKPFRIDFYNNVIESINQFDQISQKRLPDKLNWWNSRWFIIRIKKW